MVMTSCIRHPEKNRYISLHHWQVEFCQGNHCAALLLSFFSAWHDWKIKNDQYYRRFNDIAEMHGEGRQHNEAAYLFFSTEELMEGCINLYGKKAIVEAVQHLVDLSVITVHKNPNPRYVFDKTKYFQFYPRVCNRWIAENYPIENEYDSQLVDSTDSAKIPYRKCENSLSLGENAQPSCESNRAITINTNNTTNKKQSINAKDYFLSKNGVKNTGDLGEVEAIVAALVDAGMPETQLINTDDLDLLADLANAGATPVLVVEVYRDSVRATAKRGAQFGVRYLTKAIRERLNRSIKTMYHPKIGGSGEINREPAYKSNLENAMSFAADLI